MTIATQPLPATPSMRVGQTAASFPVTAFLPWALQGDALPIGHVTPEMAMHLQEARLLVPDGPMFRLDSATDHDRLSGRLEEMRAVLFEAGLIRPFRDEVMAVRQHPGAPVLAHADRSLLRPTGLWLTKVHVNGVIRGDGPPRIWLSQRSDAATSAPGEWDTLVAGGQGACESLDDTARKEGAEEAGLSDALCAGLTYRGSRAMSYVSPLGLHREVIACFDLELPESFEPVCMDDEVQGFQRLELRALRAALRGEGPAIKFSSAEALRGFVAGQPDGCAD